MHWRTLRAKLAPSLPAVLFLLASGSAAGAEEETPSLQELLRELRQRRDEAFDRHEARVRRAMEGLEQAGGERTVSFRRHARELLEMGHVASPLYLEYLDPGEEASPEAVLRAREVARVLGRLPSGPVREDLLRMAESGSSHGRVNAVRVLGSLRHDGGVARLLERTFEEAEGTLKLAALRSLASLGGERAHEALRETLEGTDTVLLRAALEIAAEEGAASAEPHVLALARDPSRGAPVARSLAAYYAALPGELDADATVALLELARSDRSTAEDGIAVLRALRELDVPNVVEVRDVLRAIAETSIDTDVVEEARINLALLGDGRTKRELLDPYDDRIDDHPEWAQAYRDRGSIHLELRDHRSAQRDFEDAIELLRERRQPTRDVWVLLARSHALDGRLRAAAEDLRAAGLTDPQLRALRHDPDFADLAASRYGDVFGPGED